MVTILFIPLSNAQYNLAADWVEASAEAILRRCPICSDDSIIGHGRRRKQAHDEQHDWYRSRASRQTIAMYPSVFAGAACPSQRHMMIQRRAVAAGIETKISCHSFRATGITTYLTNGGKLEVAQQMAGHESARTRGLYDRRNDSVALDEVERIAYEVDRSAI